MMRHLLVLVLLALLASCTSTRRDGPPNFYVDESRVHNAIPKVEPLAKYGNMRSYTVKGKRYYVMKSPRNFVQTGTASWYGTLFHARRTSSGEKYDMLAMTAAHKTLPLPTYVEVTNLRNHRKIIVKVNDRGPFSSDRIIDLSYVAAKKLGMMGRGTTYVRIKAIDPILYARQNARSTPHPAYHPSAPVMTAANQDNIYLQAGSFAKRVNAVNFQKRLSRAQPYPVRVKQPGANSKLYRVQIGPINDTASVEQISRQLKSIGITANKIQGV